MKTKARPYIFEREYLRLELIEDRSGLAINRSWGRKALRIAEVPWTLVRFLGALVWLAALWLFAKRRKGND